MALISGYDFLFKELGDPRVHDWPFMSDPWKVLGLISLYLYLIYKFLPTYMAKRNPYSLKWIIGAYNIFQVFACAALVYGIATSGWTTHYKLIGCEPPDFSESKMAIRLASYMWWNVMLKMVEFLETIFFVLRKKFNQVSFLHVYHHVSTLIMGWLVCKYFAGGMLSFTVMLNSCIHILMYTYYLLASFGPTMQKRLETIKPKLTMLQLGQLCIIFLQNMQLLSSSCAIPNIVAYLFLPSVAINIGFFIKFYVNCYLKKRGKDKIN